MDFIEIKDVSKIYQSEDGVKTYALNKVTLSFPMKGLIAIVGKSGSGKSTIINLLALLDKPSEGTIRINKKNILSHSKSYIQKYHTSFCGIIFQHYHLLESQDVLFNIMLPALIAGDSKRKAKKKAVKLLESINYPKNLYHNKCQDLSGGEKERVAVLRALINNPQILLCDEPTGALDSKNATAVMEILKDISKDKLVVVVSHNMSLTNLYADRIIKIKDGQIEEDKTINQIKIENKKIIKRKRGLHKAWSNKITLFNFKKRFIRNLISIISLSIGLIASLLIIGFSNGSNPSIIKNSYRQFDYGVATLSSEYSQQLPGSQMSLVKQNRPSFDSIDEYKNVLDKYEIENNFDALVPPYSSIKLGEEKLEDFSYRPIYSFDARFVDPSLIIHGYMPGSDNLNEVIINKKAYESLVEKTNANPLNMVIEASFDREFHYYTGEVDNPTISDVFSYHKYFHIVGVVDEMDFLSTPKIYYSYRALVDYLFDYPVNNLSDYFERKISWYERVATCRNSDELSSYSLRLFLKDIKNIDEIKNDITLFDKPLVMECNAYVLSSTLLDLVKAATMGMEVFLFIALFGTALILGIVSFSSYSEDRKTIAILTCLGANRDSIMDIYITENVIISFIALFLSFILSPLLSVATNRLIYLFTGFDEMVLIPYTSFLNIPFLLIIILVIATLFIAVFSTALPILFSSKISLKKELMDE